LDGEEESLVVRSETTRNGPIKPAFFLLPVVCLCVDVVRVPYLPHPSLTIAEEVVLVVVDGITKASTVVTQFRNRNTLVAYFTIQGSDLVRFVIMFLEE
jgi:hypothetical protein